MTKKSSSTRSSRSKSTKAEKKKILMIFRMAEGVTVLTEIIGEEEQFFVCKNAMAFYTYEDGIKGVNWIHGLVDKGCYIFKNKISAIGWPSKEFISYHEKFFSEEDQLDLDELTEEELELYNAPTGSAIN